MRFDAPASSPPQKATAEAPQDGYGPGWTQLTDRGKIYLSRKEQNVFILEGTRGAGYAACAYAGAAGDRALLESGAFTLTSELKCVPSEQLPDQEVVLLLDCASVTDLTSGCDFCCVRLCFASRELRVESLRPGAAAQTLFAVPGCALLRPQTYVTVSLTLDGDSLALSLCGASVISHLVLGRQRLAAGAAGPLAGVGLGVYGKTRCYLRRFRVGEASRSAASPKVGIDDVSRLQLAPHQGAAVRRASPPRQPGASGSTPTTSSGGGSGGGGSGGARVSARSSPSYAGVPLPAIVTEDLELAAAIERDIVTTDLQVRFEDIGGLEDAKRAINEAVVLPLLLPEFFEGLRRPWKGVLLFGPPGTGKTMLAKAVASCTDRVTFFNCSAATLTSKWRGESEKLLRALFAAARARVPSVLFFDEIDSLLSQRGGAAEHEASRRFKSEFLIHMDGLLSDAPSASSVPGGPSGAGHLLVLATSNSPWDLDEALRRRLEKRIYVPLPDEAARLLMFRHHLRDIPLTEDVDLASLARRTERYSGADLRSLCRDASMSPVRRLVQGLAPAELLKLREEGKLVPNEMPVTMADLEAALSAIQPSVALTDVERHLSWWREFGSK